MEVLYHSVQCVLRLKERLVINLAEHYIIYERLYVIMIKIISNTILIYI